MSTAGYKHTPEAKKKIAEASRGKTCPSGCACWKHSEQTRKRQSAAAKRRKSGPCGDCASGNCRRHRGKKCESACTCSRHIVSLEARRKLSESAKSRTPEQEARRLAALRKKVVGNKWASGTIFSGEERQRRSDMLKKMWAEGVFEGESRPYFGRSSGVHAGTWMRCLNSEGVFAQDCETNGVKWVYEPKRFRLSWCTYTPDFYLPEFNIWVEVKGYPKQVGNWARKVDTFRTETGKTLIVVFQKELSSCKYGGE